MEISFQKLENESGFWKIYARTYLIFFHYLTKKMFQFDINNRISR